MFLMFRAPGALGFSPRWNLPLVHNEKLNEFRLKPFVPAQHWHRQSAGSYFIHSYNTNFILCLLDYICILLLLRRSCQKNFLCFFLYIIQYDFITSICELHKRSMYGTYSVYFLFAPMRIKLISFTWLCFKTFYIYHLFLNTLQN